MARMRARSIPPCSGARSNHTWQCAGLILLSTAAAPSTAHANAGIPMLAILWPIQWLSLLLVIVVESWIVGRMARVPARQVFKPVALANLVSTLVGVPIAWMLMLLLQFATGIALWRLAGDASAGPLGYALNAAWVGDDATAVRAAVVVLSIVFCAASVWVERWWIRRRPGPVDTRTTDRAVLVANVASYLMLCTGTLAALSGR